MKKISERQKLLVTDLIAEKGLNISEYALEKDYIVTDNRCPASVVPPVNRTFVK